MVLASLVRSYTLSGNIKWQSPGRLAMTFSSANSLSSDLGEGNAQSTELLRKTFDTRVGKNGWRYATVAQDTGFQ